MNAPSIIVASRMQATVMLSDEYEQSFDAIISIGSQGDSPCPGFESVSARLRLEFDDVSSSQRIPEDEARQWYNASLDALGASKQQGPQKHHIESIIKFATEIQGTQGTLLCHCEAGISRSSAAAMMCLAVWLGPNQEQSAAQHLYNIRPVAQPHRDMILFADQLLERNGELSKAVDKVFG
jgi:predicted protein tyrosine phosphatase